MLRYGYFDSEITGVDDEGMPIFDRAETSELWRLFWSQIVSSGVLASPADCFQVIASGNGSTVIVRPGFAMVNGAFAYSSEDIELEVDGAGLVVLRANYPERLVELVFRSGATEVLQPSAGDYYELCLARIAAASNLTQSAITDTRGNSSVCGYITQLIDHIDTSVFYAQFDAFYSEFVDKTTTSYDDFVAQAQAYLDTLENVYNANAAAIVEALSDYSLQARQDFDAWFSTIKDLLDEDSAGSLANEQVELEERLTRLEHMVIANDIEAPIELSEGGDIVLLIDEDNAAICADWKYEYMKKEA